MGWFFSVIYRGNIYFSWGAFFLSEFNRDLQNLLNADYVSDLSLTKRGLREWLSIDPHYIQTILDIFTL